MINEPIRVLHMIASLNVGGSQMMIMNIYRNIDRAKVQFDFIIDHPDEIKFKAEIEDLGGKVYELPMFRGTNYMEVSKAWDNFLNVHQEYKILHTHSRSYAAIYLPIAQKHGLVTISHAHSTSNGKGLSAVAKDVLRLPIRRYSDYMFACSKEAGKWLFGTKAINSNTFRVVSNAIDTTRFKFCNERRHDIRETLNIKDEFVIGHVGRFTLPKNHAFLLEVFANYYKYNSKARLLLVGDGELRKDIEKKALELGIQNDVIFIGEKINTYDYYQAMDCFLFPSLWEGLGIAVVEAEASGLPCIVSDNVPSNVDIGAGLVSFCSLQDSSSEWANRISSRSREDMSEYVIRAGYDISENARQMQTFYEDVWK